MSTDKRQFDFVTINMMMDRMFAFYMAIPIMHVACRNQLIINRITEINMSPNTNDLCVYVLWHTKKRNKQTKDSHRSVFIN